MKKLFCIFSTLSFFGLSSCSQKKLAASYPVCISTMIQQAGEKNIEAIYRYNYKGKVVYLVQKGCCDMYDEVYTTDCTYTCAPSGGFTGKGDGKCPDFANEASNKQLIWEKPRK